MTAFFHDVGGRGQVNREDFVTGAMNMEEGLRHFRIFPFENGIDGPADEAVVACLYDVEHEFSV